MSLGPVLLDTGPWVALLCRDDTFHGWAREQFGRIARPLLTCEAVVAETCFLLARAGHDPAKALALVSRGVVRVGMSLAEEIGAVQALFERYDNVPASLADACLVRMSELYDRSRVLTLDSDFRIYRRHGRKVIPLIAPEPRADA
jgi:predicted nucleic acid-binding protein